MLFDIEQSRHLKGDQDADGLPLNLNLHIKTAEVLNRLGIPPKQVATIANLPIGYVIALIDYVADGGK